MTNISILQYELKIYILNFLLPHETSFLRLTSKEWYNMPKKSGVYFIDLFYKYHDEIIRKLKFAALCDNLDFSSEIPHNELYNLENIYNIIPSFYKIKIDINNIILLYFKMDDKKSLFFHTKIKSII